MKLVCYERVCYERGLLWTDLSWTEPLKANNRFQSAWLKSLMCFFAVADGASERELVAGISTITSIPELTLATGKLSEHV